MYELIFKDYSVYKNFLLDMHPLLQDLFLWVHSELIERTTQPIVTCAFEKRDYASVHSVLPYRGIDLRSSSIRNPRVEVNYINANWVYDMDRPHLQCCIYHNVGRGAHLHLQVSDNTAKRIRRNIT